MNWLCEFLLTVRQRLCLLPRHVTRFFFQSDTWVSGEVSRRIWIPLELAARCGYSHSSVTNSYQLTWNQPAVYSWVAGRMRWCNNDYRLTERRSKKITSTLSVRLMETSGIVGPIQHTKKFISVEIFASITAGGAVMFCGPTFYSGMHYSNYSVTSTNSYERHGEL